MNKLSSKVKPLSVAVLLGLSATSAQAVTFDFTSNAAAGIADTDFSYSTCNIDFKAGREFRMCDPTGNLGGGIPLQKDTIIGGETWDFTSGFMTDVLNTAITNGVGGDIGQYLGLTPPSASYPGDWGIDQGALFFGNYFGFLAPTLGSDAGNFYGNGQYMATGADTFEIFFPVLEAQWAGTYFPLGSAGGKGITFYGTTYVISAGDGFSMYAEELIDASEDVGSAGFAGWTPQWYLTGNLTGFVGIFADAPVANPGVLTGGRVTRAQVQILTGEADSAMQRTCVGGCFDFSVAVTAGTAVEVRLALTNTIPANAVYRKYDGIGWRDFDTSGTDAIWSGPASGDGSSGNPYSCTGAVAWESGLVEDRRCVRLDMTEGGDNDADGVANGLLTDPGGVAAPPAAVTNFTIAGETLDSGCSIASRTVNLAERADWWLVALFLGLLGIRRQYKKQKI